MTDRARLSLLLGGFLLAAAPLPALADRGREDDDDDRAPRGRRRYRDDDHEAVWRGRESGAVRPLEEILAELPSEAQRGVVEIEFEFEDGRPIYEIAYIDDAGRLVEIEIDASTGVILEQEYD